jgi:hypothetical protein
MTLREKSAPCKLHGMFVMCIVSGLSHSVHTREENAGGRESSEPRDVRLADLRPFVILTPDALAFGLTIANTLEPHAPSSDIKIDGL